MASAILGRLSFNGHGPMVSIPCKPTQNVKGKNVAGYPQLLGKANLTTSLSGSADPLVEAAPFTYAVKYVGDPDNPFIDILEGFAPVTSGLGVPIDTTAFSGQLNTALASKIYEAQAGSQSGVFLGEILETVRLVRNPLKGIQAALMSLRLKYIGLISGLRHLKKRVGKAAYNDYIVRQFSKLWLEYVYAIVPLSSDISGHIDRVKQILEDQRYTRVRVSLKDSAYLAGERAEDFFSQFAWAVTGSSRSEISGKGFALIRSLPSGSKFTPSNFGLRMQDFVPTAYQLIPFSFILDYFSNLNEYINSSFAVWEDVVYAYAGYQLIDNCENRFYPITRYLDPSTWEVISVSPGFARVTQRSVNRWKVEQSLGTFVTGTPSFKQTVNLTALAAALSDIKL